MRLGHEGRVYDSSKLSSNRGGDIFSCFCRIKFYCVRSFGIAPPFLCLSSLCPSHSHALRHKRARRKKGEKERQVAAFNEAQYDLSPPQRPVQCLCLRSTQPKARGRLCTRSPMGRRRCRPRILQERLLSGQTSWCLSRNIAADAGAANCEGADARGVAGG